MDLNTLKQIVHEVNYLGKRNTSLMLAVMDGAKLDDQNTSALEMIADFLERITVYEGRGLGVEMLADTIRCHLAKEK